MAPKPKRGKNKDNARRAKKKISILTQERVEYVDYKDVNLLRRFMSDRAKIRARRVTGNDAQQQATVAMAIKNAREMALLPYANRVTQQRSNRDRGDRGDRSIRADGPAPRPTAPPPTRDAAAGNEAGAPEVDESVTTPAEDAAAAGAVEGQGGEG
jgi:small subunit ribosomal protein S18